MLFCSQKAMASPLLYPASAPELTSISAEKFQPVLDIYSLGAMAYYFLTERIPTESQLRTTQNMPLPSEINPIVSKAWDEIILKAMDLDATQRYQRISEMREAILAITKGGKTT